MGAMVSINFRGQEVDVTFAVHEEPDVGFSSCEWSFVDPEMQKIVVTDKEEGEIIEQLYELSNDFQDYPDSPEDRQ